MGKTWLKSAWQTANCAPVAISLTSSLSLSLNAPLIFSSSLFLLIYSFYLLRFLSCKRLTIGPLMSSFQVRSNRSKPAAERADRRLCEQGWTCVCLPVLLRWPQDGIIIILQKLLPLHTKHKRCSVRRRRRLLPSNYTLIVLNRWGETRTEQCWMQRGRVAAGSRMAAIKANIYILWPEKNMLALLCLQLLSWLDIREDLDVPLTSGANPLLKSDRLACWKERMAIQKGNGKWSASRLIFRRPIFPPNFSSKP